MGQSSSSEARPPSASQSTYQKPAAAYQQPQYALPTPSGPTIYGVSDGDKSKLILPSNLGARIADALPPSCKPGSVLATTKWFLLYSSSINGKSFQRLVQHITAKGPTVVIIKLKNSPRIIGAFCESDWLTVAEREKSAKSAAAASARAAREGQARQTPVASTNQNNVFFGGEHCFVLRANSDGVESVSDDGEIYKARSSANSNFMYLFDTHPLEDKIGIGMGGQPGYFGWFIDRWLENGACYGQRCTTFSNPRLTPTETWAVESVEAYAVKPDVVQVLIEEGNTSSTGVSCVNRNPDSKADQMILELNGNHQFNNSERPDC